MDDRTLAIINAVGTTLSIIMAAYALFIVHRDRKPRLRVKAMWFRQHIIAEANEEKKDSLLSDSKYKEINDYSLRFYVANIGSVPVTLYSARVESKAQTYSGVTSMDLNKSFPYKLDSGEKLSTRVDYPFEVENLVRLSEITKKNGKFIVTDGSGQEYKTKIVYSGSEKKINQLMKELFN